MHIGYLPKVLASCLGLVLLVGLVSHAATRMAVRDAVISNATKELERGGEVLAQLMRSRVDQLALSVRVLTDEFGFQEAVAIADTDALQEALENHAQRTGADFAVVTNGEGELVASSRPLADTAWSSVASRTEVVAGGSARNSLLVDDRPYQLVVSEIRAPAHLGAAGLGFEIDNQLTAQVKRLTGVDVSFVSLEPERTRYLSGTLSEPARAPLLSWLDDNSPEFGQVLFGEDTLSLMVTITEGPTPLIAVLQLPMDRAGASFGRLSSQLFWITLGFALAAALLAVLLARNVAQPANTLAHAARRIASGYYDTPIDIATQDELGDLAEDLSKMQKAVAERERSLRHHAHHDSLTGLVNRRQLSLDIDSAIEGAKWTEGCFALLVLDIERFSLVNDDLGPEVGDQLLAAVAGRLTELSEEEDTVARLGSDEFALLLWGADVQSGQEAAERLQVRLKEAVPLAGKSVQIDVHMGLCTFPNDGANAEVLLRRAHLALTQARRQASPLVLYRPELEADPPPSA